MPYKLFTATADDRLADEIQDRVRACVAAGRITQTFAREFLEYAALPSNRPEVREDGTIIENDFMRQLGELEALPACTWMACPDWRS